MNGSMGVVAAQLRWHLGRWFVFGRCFYLSHPWGLVWKKFRRLGLGHCRIFLATTPLFAPEQIFGCPLGGLIVDYHLRSTE